MKITLMLILILFISASGIQAKSKWEKISYYHSRGPVSPEYQYSYIITIDDEGVGKLEYTKLGRTEVYDFSLTEKSLKTLNNAIQNSKALTVSPADLKSEKNLIGGPVYSCTITLPFPDRKEGEEEKEKAPVIIIPSDVNEKYAAGVFNLYQVLESVVPTSVWNEATGSK
ncbi:MAG: hypothetical protein SGI89_06370 [bacterium]|nr:hypothetical protein [bacterium]